MLQSFIPLFPFLVLHFTGLASAIPSCVVIGLVILALEGTFAVWPYSGIGGRA